MSRWETNPQADQQYGEVFTRRWVVDVLLDLTGYTADQDLGALRLLEPSCGSGAFLGPAVERLIASASARSRDLSSIADAIRAFDLQDDHVESSRALCSGLLVRSGVDTDTAEFIARTWVRRADFLLDEMDDEPVDVAIGNPPYIRYDDLPDGLAAVYRGAWKSMTGRGDIFVGFIERCLSMLGDGGRLGFICADRWMRNQYGAALRELVADAFAVEHVWTMHDVDAFETAVSAYPAITVISNRPQGSVVVADTTSEFGERSARDVANWSLNGSPGFTAVGVQAHRLPRWFSGGDLWPTGSPARLALIEHLEGRYRHLHDPAGTGTKVSIGVATGNDHVYVTKDPNVAEKDRMLPLAMRRDLMTGRFEWQGNYLVNPWTNDGSLVSLDDFPLMSAYLAGHPELRERHVAKKAPAAWHRTIDKVTPGLTERPKLLLQDMKATIHPVLEPGGFYPHHNLYYVVSDQWDLEVLGGLLLSRVAQAFIEAYCVKMRGGTLRFQAQYLKQIRVPAPKEIGRGTSEALRAAFRDRDVDAATKAAGDAYGIDLAEFELV